MQCVTLFMRGTILVQHHHISRVAMHGRATDVVILRKALLSSSVNDQHLLYAQACMISCLWEIQQVRRIPLLSFKNAYVMTCDARQGAIEYSDTQPLNKTNCMLPWRVRWARYKT